MSTIINATTTNGVVIQPDNSGSLVLQTNSGTTALTIDTSQRAAFVAGTAAAPAITTTGDTNTGIWFPAADTIAFAEGGAEAMRIDSSGKLLIGTTVTPNSSVSLLGMRQTGGDLSSTTVTRANATGITVADAISSTNNYGNGIWFDNGSLLAGIASARISTGNWGTDLRFYTHPTTTTNVDETYERMRIDSSGNLLFNSGYGSVATAFGCRAWVKFNGTGTPAINGSGNVTSITDNGTGDYTINFTTALADTNYSVVLGNNYNGTGAFAVINPNTAIYSTTQVKIQVVDRNGSAQDTSIINAAILR
jgi:hypothetical protein